MNLLETWVTRYRSADRHIKLLEGDLSRIPRHEAVDILVVSAFPGDYRPSPASLIGALNRRGVSVLRLASEKEIDLRREFSCWLSRDLSDVHPDIGFRRLLCFESGRTGSPAEAVGDVFRALMPFALGESPFRSIAMPVLAAGDQGYAPEVMLGALFDAAAHWLAHGLPVDVIKIVTYDPRVSGRLAATFRAVRSRHAAPAASVAVAPDESPALLASKTEQSLSATAMVYRENPSVGSGYNYFVSYSRKDSGEAAWLVEGIKAANSTVRIFQDQLALKTGQAWQDEIDRALEACDRVIAIYSPSYFESKVCLEEFNMARLRHRETNRGVLVPIYLRTANLPLYMRSLHYFDCREADIGRLRDASRQLADEAAVRP
jgi:hypothetical protein